jgi:folate-binding protein YgfZ
MKVDLSEQLEQTRREGGIYLLPSKLEIRLSGADAFRYLNGQVTRELGSLGKNEAFPTCILTPKGKLCAPLLIRREGNDLIIESELSLRDALIARLERYIVADDVTLSVEASKPMAHVFGKTATEEPWVSAEGIRVTRMGQPGKDLDPSLVEALGGDLMDPIVVEALRIEGGVPSWGSELTEETLPPEAGLDLTHIDYNRGCYPGQEVISRLKSIGRVNRLLHRIQVLWEINPTEENILTQGMSIVFTEGREVGVITSVAPKIGAGYPAALGYASRAASSSGKPLFALDPLTGRRTPLSITEITGS